MFFSWKIWKIWPLELMKTSVLWRELQEPPKPVSLPLTSAKEHCTSGALHYSTGVIAGKEIRTKTTNMSKRQREEMRDQINPKPNIPKGQEAKQQLKASQRLVGTGH